MQHNASCHASLHCSRELAQTKRGLVPQLKAIHSDAIRRISVDGRKQTNQVLVYPRSMLCCMIMLTTPQVPLKVKVAGDHEVIPCFNCNPQRHKFGRSQTKAIPKDMNQWGLNGGGKHKNYTRHGECDVDNFCMVCLPKNSLKECGLSCKGSRCTFGCVHKKTV
eukprot:6095347-Amphidinium_carterae.1